MTDIKPIETEYAGYKFRSRLEARWAIFFDACGADWEYEPQGYTLQDGTKYLPDFLLHGVALSGLNRYRRRSKGDVYVEIKGVVTEEARKKLEMFSGRYEYDHFRGKNPDKPFDSAELLASIQKPTIALGRIPRGDTYLDLVRDAELQEMQSKEFLFSDFYAMGSEVYSMGKVIVLPFLRMPYINKRGALTFGYDAFGDLYSYEGMVLDPDYAVDISATCKAYTEARQARFEWGETPRRCTIK